MLVIFTAVAELPTVTYNTKGVKDTLLGHDEAVQNASRCAARPDACQRFQEPRQQLMVARAPMAALPESVPAPAEGLAPLVHGQSLTIPGGN